MAVVFWCFQPDSQKTSRSLGKDIKTQDHATEVSDATQKIRDLVQDDPSKAVSGRGYLEILRKAGSQGDGLVVPSVLEVMLNDPEKISEWILNGGLHEDLTIETRQNAIDGLDGTRDFRNLIGDGQAPDPNVVAPLSFGAFFQGCFHLSNRRLCGLG